MLTNGEDDAEGPKAQKSDPISTGVDAYRHLQRKYASFALRLAELLTHLLAGADLKVHTLEHRGKSVESLQEKLQRRKPRTEKPLEGITDLAGLRIILYYADHVSRVGDFIEREFTVLEKPADHHDSPERFGYSSTHYVITLSEPRSNLGEWAEFRGMRAEIQIRTMLQHAWAAVSHALQYKREGDVPLVSRRRLHRLAGLFELADEQFIELRNQQSPPPSEAPVLVELIDATSIGKFLRYSPKFASIKRTTKEIGYEYDDENGHEIVDFQIGSVVHECERLGLHTIAELESLLDYDYGRFLQRILGDGWVVNDAFVLLLLLIGARPQSFPQKYLLERGWSPQNAAGVVSL